MHKKYFLAGVLVLIFLGLLFFFDTGTKIVDRILPEGTMEDQDNQNLIQDKDIPDIIKNIKLDKERSIVIDKRNSSVSASSGEGSGGGGGGEEGSGCSGASYTLLADYYVKARVSDIEIVPSEDGTKNLTYIYASADEYEKTTQTDPDLAPEDILIISPDDGAQNPEDPPAFVYAFLKTEQYGFSMVC